MSRRRKQTLEAATVKMIATFPIERNEFRFSEKAGFQSVKMHVSRRRQWGDGYMNCVRIEIGVQLLQAFNDPIRRIFLLEFCGLCSFDFSMGG